MKYNEILLTQFLIQQQTFTPEECGVYDVIKSILYDFKSIEIEKNGVKNLFLYFDSKNKENHICFAGHIDVVSVGDASKWKYDPFGSEIIDNKMYGRGAQDMKSGVAAVVMALREYIDMYQEPSFMLSVLLTSDEEGDGIYGTKVMLEHLKEINLLPTFAIVAEPTSDIHMGDTIKIGRRGSINGIITIHGKQGHAAYPNKCINPVEILGERLGDLAGIKIDNGNEFFDPSKMVITDIRGGFETTNVTPENLKIMFNVRNSPASDKDDIQNYINKTLDGIDFTLEFMPIVSFPFISDANNTFVKSLSKTIQSITSQKPKFSTSGGTSDARYFAPFEICVCEVGVLNDKIHAIDECVETGDISTLKEIFKSFLIDIS